MGSQRQKQFRILPSLPVNTASTLGSVPHRVVNDSELRRRPGPEHTLLGYVVIFTVIPAKAGIYACRLRYRSRRLRRCIPAFAGMTVVGASQ